MRHRQGEDGDESFPTGPQMRCREGGTERVFDRFGGELFAILFTGWECGRARRAKGEAAYV